MNDAHLPRLPKIPFIVVDAILIITALAIAYSGEGPLSPLSFFWVIFCLSLGGILACLPFYVEFHAHVRLTEYDKSQANLENVQRMEAILAEMQQIQEGTHALATHYEKTAREINEISQRTSEHLDALEAFQFPEPPPPPPPPISQPAPLPPELALQLSAIFEKLEELQLPQRHVLSEDLDQDLQELASLEPEEESADDESKPQGDEELDEKHAEEISDEEEVAQEDLIEDDWSDNEIGNDASSDEDEEDEETWEDLEDADDQDPEDDNQDSGEDEQDESEENGLEEDGVEEDEDFESDEEADESDEEDEETLDDTIGNPEAAWDEDWPLSDSDNKQDKPTPSPAENALQPELMPDLPQGSDKARKPGRNETVLIAQVLIGIGNKPYIRGEGPGLSPDKGVPMEFLEIGKWQWVSPDGNLPITCQLYKNDEVPAEGGPIHLEPGQRRTIAPRFP